mgnify:CR=1 FL=1
MVLQWGFQKEAAAGKICHLLDINSLPSFIAWYLNYSDHANKMAGTWLVKDLATLATNFNFNICTSDNWISLPFVEYQQQGLSLLLWSSRLEE